MEMYFVWLKIATESTTGKYNWKPMYYIPLCLFLHGRFPSICCINVYIYILYYSAFLSKIGKRLPSLSEVSRSTKFLHQICCKNVNHLSHPTRLRELALEAMLRKLTGVVCYGRDGKWIGIRCFFFSTGNGPMVVFNGAKRSKEC